MNKTFKTIITITKDLSKEEDPDEIEILESIVKIPALKKHAKEAYSKALNLGDDVEINIQIDIIDPNDSAEDEIELWTKDHHRRDNFNDGDHLSDL